MEVTNSLLVAMMFVMVLSIGIGNILMNLSALLDRRTAVHFHWLPTSWLLLLLLQHLHMFWHTLAILDADEWGFGGFLYVVTGPVLLFLATSLMLPHPVPDATDDPLEHYFRVSPQFFSILSVLMLWMIGADLVLGKGFTSAGAWNAATLPLCLVLAASRERRLHALATGATWALSLSLLLLRGLGVVA